MFLRLRDADIAIYRTHICPVDLHTHDYPWDTSDDYFNIKWKFEDDRYVKTKQDVTDDCETTSMFLPWEKSVLSDIPLRTEALR
tara:strand:- start:2346 stop:2597 length:252 start_codon:yes stop_codon:yes gene_type:complete